MAGWTWGRQLGLPLVPGVQCAARVGGRGREPHETPPHPANQRPRNSVGRGAGARHTGEPACLPQRNNRARRLARRYRRRRRVLTSCVGPSERWVVRQQIKGLPASPRCTVRRVAQPDRPQRCCENNRRRGLGERPGGEWRAGDGPPGKLVRDVRGKAGDITGVGTAQAIQASPAPLHRRSREGQTVRWGGSRSAGRPFLPVSDRRPRGTAEIRKRLRRKRRSSRELDHFCGM